MHSIIKKQRIQLTDRARASGPASSPPTIHGAGIELLSRDGAVHGLQLTCACGEVTVVEFEYDGAAGEQHEEPTSDDQG